MHIQQMDTKDDLSRVSVLKYILHTYNLRLQSIDLDIDI